MEHYLRTIKILLRNQTILYHRINEQPIARGGEGAIYRYVHKVDEIEYAYILKLYTSKAKAARNFNKMRCMVNHPITSSSPTIRFCWPIGLVYDNRTSDFIGFVMPEAFEGSRDMEILSAYYPNSSIAERFPNDYLWHNIFELNSNQGLKNRLHLLYQWALAITELQTKGQIVIGDIKPSNILCTPDGRLSVVDIDSMQFTQKKHVYMSSAHSADYCPREVMKNRAMLCNLPPSYDVFSFVVSAYTILTGTHPFASVINLPPYNTEKYQKISSMIEAGLYLRGEKSKYLKTLPNGINPHDNFDRIPEILRQTFNKILTSSMNEYPSMSELCLLIKKSIYNE